MILLSYGSNLPGTVGEPRQTFDWVRRRLCRAQIDVVDVSGIYMTEAIGQPGQSVYVNAVFRIVTVLRSQTLLRIVQTIEEEAGRQRSALRSDGRWASRPLDLDILDYRGVVLPDFFKYYLSSKYCQSNPINIKCQPGRLVLPHPRLHERPFVVVPLMDVAPFWHHPATHQSIRNIWCRLGRVQGGGIIRRID